jgi:hypothetical protein
MVRRSEPRTGLNGTGRTGSIQFSSGSGSVLAQTSRFGSRFSKMGGRTGLNRTLATLYEAH